MKKVEVCPISLRELINELKWKRKEYSRMSRELEIFDAMTYLATIKRPSITSGETHPCHVRELEISLEKHSSEKK